MTQSEKQVLVPLADGFEEMEGIIIIDVLRRAGVKVVSAGLNPGKIIASRGTIHLADMTMEEAEGLEFDMVVLPGGLAGAENLEKNAVVRRVLNRMRDADRHIAAICAAPNVLRNMKIIDMETPFTVHPATLGKGEGGLYKEERIVHAGKVVTSVGPGSAFEFALALVEILCGPEKRESVAGPMYLPA